MESSEWLTGKVKEGVPFSAGKLGTGELEILMWFLLDKFKQNENSGRIMRNFFINAGFWSPDNNKTNLYIEIWCRKILQALSNMNGIVLWNGQIEKHVVEKYTKNAQILALRDLEPYYKSKWTLALPDDSILAVVSPFSKTIEYQIHNLDKIWPLGNVWKTGQKFVTIQTFYGPGLNENGSAGWPQEIIEKGPFEAVRSVVEQVVDSKATHAIIGCGCLSLLIADELKRKGISAVHTGGATQIFFGIKGQRWVNHSVISGFMNEWWVHPSFTEIPNGARNVEGGCYW